MKDPYDKKVYEAIRRAGFRNGVRYVKNCIAQCADMSISSENPILRELDDRISALEKKSKSRPVSETEKTIPSDGIDNDDVLAFLETL